MPLLGRPRCQQVTQEQGIGRAELFEPCVEAVMHGVDPSGDATGLGIMPHHQQREGGHERSRKDVGGQHGENYGFSQWHEQELGHAAQEKHRYEHDTDGKRRDKRRHRDFAGAIQDGLVQARSHVQVTLDILDGHRGVIHQDADSQCQPAQRHHVDRLAQQLQADQRDKDRQRDRDRDDGGGAPVAQEEKQHHRREPGSDQGFVHHTRDRGLHEDRLVRQQLYVNAFGQQWQQRRQLLLDVRHDVQRRGAAVLERRENQAALAVLAHDVGLGRKPVSHVGHFAQVGRCTVHRPDRDVVEPLKTVGR